MKMQCACERNLDLYLSPVTYVFSKGILLLYLPLNGNQARV